MDRGVTVALAEEREQPHQLDRRPGLRGLGEEALARDGTERVGV
jgi:hypothetical protein